MFLCSRGEEFDLFRIAIKLKKKKRKKVNSNIYKKKKTDIRLKSIAKMIAIKEKLKF